MTATATCPRCGLVAPARAARCRACDFVFFEEPPRRSLPRPSPIWIAAGVLVLAAGVAIALLLTRDSPPQPVEAVTATSAEQRLESQLRVGGGPPGSVHCPGSIRPGRPTRCEFVYTDGDTQLMVVSLTVRGELDIEVPYPAQRRPGG